MMISRIIVASAFLSTLYTLNAIAAEPTIRLNAIIATEGDEPQVGLVDMQTGNAALLKAGDKFQGLEIESIEPEQQVIMVRIDGEMRRISLKGDPKARIIPLPRINRSARDYVERFKPAEVFSTNLTMGTKTLKIYSHPDDPSIAIIEYDGKRYAMSAKSIRSFAMDGILYDEEKIRAIMSFPGLVELKEGMNVVEEVAAALERAKPPPPPPLETVPPPPPRMMAPGT